MSKSDWKPAHPGSGASDEQVMATPIYQRLIGMGILSSEDTLPVAREALDKMWGMLHPEWTPPQKVLPDFRSMMLRTILEYVEAERSHILKDFDVPSFSIPDDKQLDAGILFDVVVKDLRDACRRNLQEPWTDHPVNDIGIGPRDPADDDEPTVRR